MLCYITTLFYNINQNRKGFLVLDFRVQTKAQAKAPTAPAPATSQPPGKKERWMYSLLMAAREGRIDEVHHYSCQKGVLKSQNLFCDEGAVLEQMLRQLPNYRI